MPVSLSPALAAIPDPQTTAAHPGVLNLASNELPTAPIARVVAAIVEAAAAANRYPQNGSTDLTTRLCDHHQIAPTQLALDNGSANVLLQLLRATCQRNGEVLFTTPSFEAYPTLVRLAGGEPVAVPTIPESNQLDALLARIDRSKTRAIILCNPHNPTGSLCPLDELTDFLDQVPEHILVILDEAYHEFVTVPEASDGVALVASGAWGNLAVTRTFSKAFALGGARVGYAAAAPDLAAAVRKSAVPYSVNRFAQAAATAALDTADELAPMHEELRRQRDRLRDELVAVGFEVPPSHANFLWLPVGEQAQHFYDHCLRHKILVRLYPAEGVRVTIARAEDNHAFLSAARTFTPRLVTTPTPGATP
jgi:histidinol-phosphate aminotransferase